MRRRGKVGERSEPAAWPPVGSPRKAGGRAPQARFRRPPNDRPKGESAERNSIRRMPAKANHTRHSGRPARKDWGKRRQPPAERPRSVHWGGRRWATPTEVVADPFPPKLAREIGPAPDTIDVSNLKGQFWTCFLLVQRAVNPGECVQKTRTKSPEKWSGTGPHAVALLRGDGRQKTGGKARPRSGCRRAADQGFPVAGFARRSCDTMRAETLRPASAKVAAICSGS